MRFIIYFLLTIWGISVDYFIRNNFNWTISFWKWSGVDIIFYVVFIMSSIYIAPYLYFETYGDRSKKEKHSLNHTRSIFFSVSILTLTLGSVFILSEFFLYIADKFPYPEYLSMGLALIVTFVIVYKTDAINRIRKSLSSH